ncbi:MAG: hypothetical protein AMJ69_13335, partial [Gammaproteobacteria bacterium SG8_47]
ERQGQADQSLLPEGFRIEYGIGISAVGDLMRATGLGNSKEQFYAKVADSIFGSDISFANLESTVINIDDCEKGLHVNITADEFNALKGHQGRQYTVFSTANNHILDGGMKGIVDTHERLIAEGIHFVGTNRSREDQDKGLIIESSGVRIGFVAATYGVNDKPFPKGEDYLVNVVPFHDLKENTDLSLLDDQIAWCRSQNCDCVIVSLHWGLEFEFFPRTYQVDIAHQLAERGADALISHHTHNLQPYEIYQTQRDPDRKVPIFYGLGNLSSWSSAAYRSLSLITKFRIAKGRIDGVEKTLVKDVSMIPVLQMKYESETGPYLQLEVLGALMESGYDNGKQEYINDAARYADLILGKSWRDERQWRHKS